MKCACGATVDANDTFIGKLYGSHERSRCHNGTDGTPCGPVLNDSEREREDAVHAALVAAGPSQEPSATEYDEVLGRQQRGRHA